MIRLNKSDFGLVENPWGRPEF